MKTVRDFIFLGSKITADGDCSHEIKRCLLLGRKAMTNLNSVLKSRVITLPTKTHLLKAMIFPVVMYGRESWTIKKAEHWRTDAFELWCRRRLLRVPWTARRSNQSILKEINPTYSLEGLMLKLKLHYFGYLMWRTDSLEKTLMLGKTEGRKKRQWQRMRCLDDFIDSIDMSLNILWELVINWEAWRPWSHKELDAAEWLNWLTDTHIFSYHILGYLALASNTRFPRSQEKLGNMGAQIWVFNPWFLNDFEIIGKFLCIWVTSCAIEFLFDVQVINSLSLQHDWVTKVQLFLWLPDQRHFLGTLTWSTEGVQN